MEIIIHGNKVKITKAMNDYVEEKLERLEKYLENSEKVSASVIVKVKGHEQTVEITIPLKSFILRSEETKDDFYAAVDKTIDKLERQLRKNKTRLMSKKVKQSYDFNFESIIVDEPEEKEEELREAHGNVVGKVIISRCTNCGKVTSKLIYTETGYER